MRRTIFLVVVLAALTMSSCKKSGDTSVQGITASVELRLQGLAAATRATGAIPEETTDNVITTVTVGLFKTSDGTTDAITEGVLTAGRIAVTGTQGTRDIIVVANAPSGTFAGVKTKSDFLAKTLSLTQTKTLLPMSGTVSSVSLVPGTPATADVSITRLVARIQLVSVKTAFDPVGLYSQATFTADKVFLYNAKSTSTPDATPVTTNLVHGWDGTTATYPSLLDAISPAQAITSTAYTTPYYDYTFANDATLATATKLVIGGLFKADGTGAGVYVYYPAVVNRVQSGTVITGNTDSHTGIKRNCIYTISATIKGIGVDSPDKFIEPANLDLGVTVSPWALTVSQDVVF